MEGEITEIIAQSGSVTCTHSLMSKTFSGIGDCQLRYKQLGLVATKLVPRFPQLELLEMFPC